MITTISTLPEEEDTWGTVTVMLVFVQLVTVAFVPLNVTVPCVVPKFTPVIIRDDPTAPEGADKLEIPGSEPEPPEPTMKRTPLLERPPTVTTTFPVVAPAGTGTTIVVAFQLVGVAVTPLNVTVLVPCVAPKLVPVIVTEVPTGPDVGDRGGVILGVADDTVNKMLLLNTPPTVTDRKSVV